MVSLIRLSLPCSIDVTYMIKLSVVMCLHGSKTPHYGITLLQEAHSTVYDKKRGNWNGAMT